VKLLSRREHRLLYSIDKASRRDDRTNVLEDAPRLLRRDHLYDRAPDGCVKRAFRFISENVSRNDTDSVAGAMRCVIGGTVARSTTVASIEGHTSTMAIAQPPEPPPTSSKVR
jgi:hypothetical protein